jgi:ATP-dependent RNA helicase DHX37/DHR1
LPEGGILVFVTGQQEVQVLSHKLKKTFPILRDGETRQIAVPKKEKRQKKAKKEMVPKLQDIPKINLDK